MASVEHGIRRVVPGQMRLHPNGGQKSGRGRYRSETDQQPPSRKPLRWFAQRRLARRIPVGGRGMQGSPLRSRSPPILKLLPALLRPSAAKLDRPARRERHPGKGYLDGLIGLLANAGTAREVPDLPPAGPPSPRTVDRSGRRCRYGTTPSLPKAAAGVLTDDPSNLPTFPSLAQSA